MKRPRGGLPVRAIVQVIRSDWALRYRLAEQPSRVTVSGIQLDLGGDWATPAIREAVYEGWYEGAERDILARTLRRGDRYLELGAGIGFIATCACQLVGDENVTAYEANPALVAVARATAGHNGFAPTIVNAALGDVAGDAYLYVADDFWASTLVPTEVRSTVRVPVKSFHAELERVRPTYLMIDIEGGEVDLLSGNTLPEYVRAVCVEAHPNVVGVARVQDMLVKLIKDGFAIDLQVSHHGVAYLERPD